MADDLLDQLRAGQEPVDRGRFRIDSQRALDKLRQYRLADPHHYVLELLRAAVASDATWVKVSVDADDFELQFNGAPLRSAAMGDLLGQALMGGDDRDSVRSRLFSLGIAGALALEPSFVRVQSGGVAVELDSEARATVSKATLRPGQAKTTVHVKDRLSWRVARNAVLGSREAAVISQLCSRYPLALTLNKQRIEWIKGDPPFEEPVLGVAELEVGGARIVAAVPERRLKESLVRFHVFGVQVCERRLLLPTVQVLATVHDDALQRNASGSDVVDSDPRFLSALKALEGSTLPLIAKLAKGLKAAADDPARDVLLELSTRARGTDLSAVLDDAPLLPGPAGEWYSANDFRAEQTASRPLRFANRRFPAGSYTPPAILVSDAMDEQTLALLPGRLRIDVADEVAWRIQAAEHRGRWSDQQPSESKLDPADCLVWAQVKGKGFSGEVGVLKRGRGRPGVHVTLQKKHLFTTDPHQLPSTAAAVIDVHSQPAADGWSKPNAGIALERFLHDLWAAITEATAKEVTASPVLSDDLRHLVRRIIVHAISVERPKDVVLPGPLREAQVYPLAGGGYVSVAELQKWPKVLWVLNQWPIGLLSGDPVVMLEPLFEAKYLARNVVEAPFEGVERRLVIERRIRDQLDAAPQTVRLPVATLVTVPIDGPFGEGEVGIPADPGSGAQLRVYTRGLLLETTTLTARYGLAAAAIASDKLTPRDDWAGVVRDAAFQRAIEQVREAERELVLPLLRAWSKRAVDTWPAAGRKYLRTFIQKELSDLPNRTELDPIAAEVADASIFRTAHGVKSLREIAASARAQGQIWLSAVPILGDVPKDMLVISAYDNEAMAEAIVAAAGVPTADPTEELARRSRREAFAKQRQVAAKVHPPRPLTVPVEVPELLRGEVGGPTAKPGARVQVLVGGRPFTWLQVQTTLGLEAVVDVAGAAVDPALPLPPPVESQIADVIRGGELRLLELAAERPDAPSARSVVFAALGANLDAQLDHARRQKVLERPLVPTSDGGWLSVDHFDEQRRVGYVTRKVDGAPRSGPVVLADEGEVMALMPRWPSAEDVTESVEAELRRRRSREALPPVEKFEYGGVALVRLPIEGLEGQVALISSRAGALNLYHLRRPLCVVHEEALPRCAAIIVNDDRLTLTHDETDVIRDDAYHALIRHLAATLNAASARAAEAWAGAAQGERARLRPMLLTLAAWHARSKKPKAPLLCVPLLQTSDGKPLTVAWFLAEKEAGREVLWSEIEGAPLESSKVVWLPGPGERVLATDLDIPLHDVTDQIRVANERRAEARAETLEVGSGSPWREAIPPPRRGEVVLDPSEPSGQLSLQIYKGGILIETCTIPHPVGAMIKVNDDSLSPTKGWRKAARNAAFRDLRAAVEHCLELATVRRLSDRSDGWLAYARAALRWRSGGSGPLAEAMPALELFTDVRGNAVRLGAVLAEVSRRGAIALLDSTLAAQAPSDRLVLAHTADAELLLRDLQLRTDDLTEDVRAAENLAASRSARRLAALQDPAPALVRLSVHREGRFRGELSLPVDVGHAEGITLCREGVAVTTHPTSQLGVGGALEHPELEVDASWTSATLTVDQRRDLQEEVDALFVRLAGICAGLETGHRLAAATYVLRYFKNAGMTDAAQLDRLPEAAQRIADAPAFRAAEGRWVGLRTAAAQALTNSGLAVLGSRVRPDDLPALALWTEDLAAEWVSMLTEVLGARRVHVVRDLRAYQEATARADPEEDTPLGRGLRRLRREAGLLRGDALGPRLTAQELAHVKVHRRGGKGPMVRYDEASRVASIDPDHPGVRAALEAGEANPEGVYVLLAAVYGAVNRALDRVTDHDEAKMLSGLLRHLAANPDLLSP